MVRAARILVVDDEPSIQRGLIPLLRSRGYQAESAMNAAAAITAFEHFPPDLIVLDLGLPDLEGSEVCRRIRTQSAVPIIVLSARGGEADKIAALDLGADDYVTKPFSPRELVLRVKRLLRSESAKQDNAERIEIGELTLDIPRHQALVKGKRIDLTATEFRLLTVLVKRRGRVQTRDQLLRDVWEYDSLIDTRTVDTHMRRLREKLGAAAKHLDTVRGVGYRFVAE
jgi:DNA-binding response OmpR family regulator